MPADLRSTRLGSLDISTTHDAETGQRLASPTRLDGRSHSRERQ